MALPRLFTHVNLSQIQTLPPPSSGTPTSGIRFWDAPDSLGNDLDPTKPHSIYIKSDNGWAIRSLENGADGAIVGTFPKGEYQLIFVPSSNCLQLIAIDPDPGTGTRR